MNCQRCRRALILDGSLQDLDPAAYGLLVDSRHHKPNTETDSIQSPYPVERLKLYEQANEAASSPVLRRALPTPHHGKGKNEDGTLGAKENTAMSFMMLTDSEVIPARHATRNPQVQIAKKLADEDIANIAKESSINETESVTRLFDILSSRSDIDHPICSECTDLLLVSLKIRLDGALKERDAYISFAKRIASSEPTTAAVAEAKQALDKARTAEAEAVRQLKASEAEKAALEDETAELEAESLALDKEEEEFWMTRNTYTQELAAAENERDAVQAAYEHDILQLERLQRTNVYNDTLHVASEGIFATINGLRLGRNPPTHSVEWSEINAAWGYAALLLATVAEKLGFTFRGYKIVPIGSTSKIEQEDRQTPESSTNKLRQQSASHSKKGKISILDLHSSGDLPLGVTSILHRKINAGMAAFLECLRQLCEFVEQSKEYEMPIKLPYIIRGDKIGNDDKGFRSIRIGVSSDEEWTDACRFTLTCCKFLLAAMGHRLDARK